MERGAGHDPELPPERSDDELLEELSEVITLDPVPDWVQAKARFVCALAKLDRLIWLTQGPVADLGA